jgi:RimJ/RimL family protein N-acetyltransferase
VRAPDDYGFGRLGLDEILVVAMPQNGRSRRVIERLDIPRGPDEDFDHPNLPAGLLQRHVLYRLRSRAPRL